MRKGGKGSKEWDNKETTRLSSAVLHPNLNG